MRIESLDVTDVPPIKRFSVDGLSDIVVIAGPNGVGKTRLIQRLRDHLRGGTPSADVNGVIRATTDAEIAAWGKDALILSDSSDISKLRDTLQANRARHRWRSSVLNFESDRTIRNLRPIEFAWDMPDPYDEEIGWDATFGDISDRFQDTVQSMFRRIKAQRDSLGNRGVQLGRSGKKSMQLNYRDPMQPFKDVFRQMLAPKELLDPSTQQQRLQYGEGGAEYELQASLSSGEREVVNIAFDFLLRQPEDCIVFFDEPELHLHPELSYKLIQVLQTIGHSNQFFLSTHSPDIITASLEHTVVFVAAPAAADSTGNQAVVVSEADETNRALRLLGHSVGIVSLGRRIVLIEGEHSSLDKQTYGAIAGGTFPSLVLVPSGGRHVLESFSTVYERVLSRTLWGVEFFMLCDGDSTPNASPNRDRAIRSGRLQILPRYHLENYFLDEAVWARAFTDLEGADSWLRDPRQVREALRAEAESLVSYAASLRISADLRSLVGNIDVMPADCHGKSVDELVSLFRGSVSAELSRATSSLDLPGVEAKVRARYQELTSLIQSDDDRWKIEIPGKPVLRKFAAKVDMQIGRMKRIYIQSAMQPSSNTFADIVAILSRFEST